MKLPSIVAPGTPITARQWNDLLAYLRSITPRGGPGTKVSRNSGGVTITAAPAAAKGYSTGGATLVHPFLITDVSDDDGPKVKVRYGTLNDMEPTGVAFEAATDLDEDGTWRIYLEVTLNTDGSVSGVELIVDDVAQPADDDTHAYITLGTVDVTDGEIDGEVNQAATHSLRFACCGRATDGGSVTTRGSYNFWGF